jgi:hypothetical protein
MMHLKNMKDLSQSLQAASVQIHRAHRLTRLVKIFPFQKAEGGEYYVMACNTVCEGKSRCVSLLITAVRASSDEEIN